jgi:hypothetical protein
MKNILRHFIKKDKKSRNLVVPITKTAEVFTPPRPAPTTTNIGYTLGKTANAIITPKPVFKTITPQKPITPTTFTPITTTTFTPITTTTFTPITKIAYPKPMTGLPQRQNIMPFQTQKPKPMTIRETQLPKNTLLR